MTERIELPSGSYDLFSLRHSVLPWRIEEMFHALLAARRENARLRDVTLRDIGASSAAEVNALRAENERLREAAKKVMALLQEFGPSIVPHLLDTDDNPGERLRAALAAPQEEEAT